MAPKSHNSNNIFFIIILTLVSIFFMFLVIDFASKYNVTDSDKLEGKPADQVLVSPNPTWFDLIQEENIGVDKKIKVGLVNFGVEDGAYLVHGPSISTVHVHFDQVFKKLQWKNLFPEWIDEDQKSGQPTCPDVPMPPLEEYRDLDVVVARVPCEGWTVEKGLRDVYRLQVNLVVANLLVRGGWVKPRSVYAVFIGGCGPMPEIFRCDDMVRKEGDHWLYKPELWRLKEKVLMPLGSCQIGIAQPYEKTGKEAWTYNYSTSDTRPQKQKYRGFNQKEAYVTVLHSSNAYVCGAIALAQSIIQSNSTKDLLLLHDENISPKSLKGLKHAGWKTRQIDRIRSPFSKKGSYNEWNYTKLRIWLLTWYDKVIFIDADILVLKNIDWLFDYPQLSAAGNDQTLFNSGIMVIEPSLCMFEDLMTKSYKVESYNGGDQGYLNEIFTWWHRLPSKVNYLKIYEPDGGQKTIPDDLYAIHYLGLKPWMCYRDYDCNWDIKIRQIFASDEAHEKWWKVYDVMPKKLQKYCGLTKLMNWRIRKWRRIAKNGSLPDEHWKIGVKDPRQYNLVQ